MGFFDRITNLWFKTDQDGRTLFYPWTFGAFGVYEKGYVLPGPEKEREIRKYVKRYSILGFMSFPVIYGTGIIIGWIYALALASAGVVAYYTWYFLQIRRLVSGLPTTTVKYQRKEILNKMAQVYSTGVLWFSEVLSILFLLFFIWLLVTQPAIWWLSSIVIMGACGLIVMFGNMIRAKKKK